MGKHKHKKSKKSKKSSRNQDSSDEWEETTALDGETSRSKARSKMRMPLEDEEEDVSSKKISSVHRSAESASGSKASNRPSWRKQNSAMGGSLQKTPADLAVSETSSEPHNVSENERVDDGVVKESAGAENTVLGTGAKREELHSESSIHQARAPERQPLEQGSGDRVRSLPAAVAETTTRTEADTLVEQAGEILSDDKMNQLSAKILKAELRGDQDTVQRLKMKLESATRARLEAQRTTDDAAETVVIITKGKNKCSDRNKRGSSASAGRSDRKKMRTEDAWRRLEDKFVRKKVEDDEKMDAVLQRALNKMDAGSSRCTTGEEEDQQLDDQDRDSDVRVNFSDRKKAEEFMESCPLCVDSSNCVKHLIIYSGENLSLMLPRHESLTDFHCLLVPKEHLPVLTHADKETWSEIQDMRNLLSEVFEAEDMDCIFLQTTTLLSRRAHAVIHCVPVPSESAEMMPMYFKKAIEECETEWSMNKKLVRLSDGGVRACIPKGLPYFAVDFGKQNGYAHVIEDRERFPDYFGLEILGSVLDVTPSTWLKPRSESFQDQSKKVLRFENIWAKHECAKKLAS